MLNSNENLEMSASSPTNQIDYTKHQGVRQTNSGKWGAAIRHPITKNSVWLGSYNTPKEAADAFIKKKSEYQSLEVHKVQVDYDSVCLETCNSDENYANAYSKKLSNKHLEFSAPSPLKHKGVRQTNSRKWGAVIRHPISKISVWLGTYNSPKEASDAFIKKKMEYQSLTLQKNKDFVKKKPNIQDPGNCESPCLGSCNSAEDARKKVEFDAVVTNATVEETEDALSKMTSETKFMDQADINCNKSRNHVIEEETARSPITTIHPSVDLAEASDNTDVAIRDNRLSGSGSISPKKPGIWSAQICYGNSEVHVGIYSTFEELEAAIHKKRQELNLVAHVEAIAKEPVNGELMCNDQNPEKQVNIIKPCSEQYLVQVVSNNDLDSVDGVQVVAEEDRTATISQESVALNRKRCVSALLNNAEKKCKQSIDVAEEDLQVTNFNVNFNVEDVQVSCSLFESNDEFNTGIVNAYGQLVGEFNRLDDDLWLV